MTEGKAVLVTGGAKRIGAALIRRFSKEGYAVLIHYQASGLEAKRLEAEILDQGGRAHSLQTDLENPEALEPLINQALALEPGLRLWINCAAIFEYDTAFHPDPDIWCKSLKINAFAPAALTAYFHQKVEGGIVVQFLDQKLANPNPDYFSYTASKAAFAEVIRMQAMAYAPRTKVIGIAPGIVLASGDQTRDEYEQASLLNPLSRATRLKDIEDAVLFASSGQLTSGEILYVDGGQHLSPQSRDVMFLVRE